MNISIYCFLIVSALMLAIGIYGFLTRRNTLAILISVELILNAADLTAAETAIAIAVMINIYRNLKNNFVENLDSMKW